MKKGKSNNPFVNLLSLTLEHLGIVEEIDEKFEVLDPSGCTVSVVNPDLVDELGISDETLEKIKDCHALRATLEESMYHLNPKDKKSILLAHYKAWTENEFRLQDLWGFERNSNYHKDYLLPHCTCPKIDNDEMYPHGKIISGDCVYHGKA